MVGGNFVLTSLPDDNAICGDAIRAIDVREKTFTPLIHLDDEGDELIRFMYGLKLPIPDSF